MHASKCLFLRSVKKKKYNNNNQSGCIQYKRPTTMNSDIFSCTEMMTSD